MFASGQFNRSFFRVPKFEYIFFLELVTVINLQVLWYRRVVWSLALVSVLSGVGVCIFYLI